MSTTGQSEPRPPHFMDQFRHFAEGQFIYIKRPGYWQRGRPSYFRFDYSTMQIQRVYAKNKNQAIPYSWAHSPEALLRTYRAQIIIPKHLRMDEGL